MSSEDITRAEISGLLQAVARLEAVAQQQQISMTRLADTVDRLVRTQEAQSADVETFWHTGKGAQWDADIKANTAQSGISQALLINCGATTTSPAPRRLVFLVAAL
jgi:uncharacterized protein YigE (DUF2233 family)